MNKMMMILAGLALSFNAVAAKSVVAAKKSDKVKVMPTQTLTLDTGASKAAWTGKKVAGPHNGTLSFKSGTFTVGKGKSMTGEVVADMTSIADTDLTDAEYNKKLVTHLKSEDFFNVEKFPTATFKIKSFTEVNNFVAGQPNAIVKGDLTIRGITKPSEIKMFFTPGDDGFEAKGKLIVDRTKYNIQYNSKKWYDVKSLGDKLIDDNFEVDLTLVAKKEVAKKDEAKK